MGAMSGTLFNLGEAYQFGYNLHKVLCRDMADGKPISCPEDTGLLAQMIHYGKGDHLEIGTAYGGSLLVALKTMDEYNRRRTVICIEPFGEERRDTIHKAVEKEFWRNVEHFKIQDRFELIKAFSHPFPIKKRRFSTALIDGDHAYEYVMNDWLNTKDVVDHYIMFHDYTRETVRNVVIQAAQDRDWIIVAIHGWSAVLKRRLD
jgi:hypothetical protein